jgi:hypothetical protein
MANLVEKTLGKALGAIFKNFSPDKLEMVTLFEATVLFDCAGNALLAGPLARRVRVDRPGDQRKVLPLRTFARPLCA